MPSIVHFLSSPLFWPSHHSQTASTQLCWFLLFAVPLLSQVLHLKLPVPWVCPGKTCIVMSSTQSRLWHSLLKSWVVPQRLYNRFPSLVIRFHPSSQVEPHRFWDKNQFFIKIILIFIFTFSSSSLQVKVVQFCINNDGLAWAVAEPYSTWALLVKVL